MALDALTPVTEADDLRRRVLWAVPTVLGVLGSLGDDAAGHLMNISWVTPVGNEPTRLVASIESTSVTAANLTARAGWTLSLLSLAQRDLGRAFVKSSQEWRVDDDGEFANGARVRRSAHGVPYLAEAVAVLAGGASDRVRALGDHVLFLLDVDEVAARADLLEGPASHHAVGILGVRDTRMNYGR